MSEIVVEVENLSKSYLISHQKQENYTALRDVLTNGVKNFAKRLTSSFSSDTSFVKASQEEFFALDDISFQVEQGERLGIIGRNGAGKSTLLKILSRITEPTRGRVTIDGRVASLLEVGTGFHPELSGRENIFLNGAILGMSKAEIKTKFDEIVSFAEIEKFLDTPVKRYSSGMYVRLAFAVAAHLESEILIVDEVLAVGDAQFQKKCLGKMEGITNEGRTVLFVSHNLSAVRQLCSKAMYLEDGKVRALGCVNDVIQCYQSEINCSINSTYKSEYADEPVSLTSVEILNESNVVTNIIKMCRPLTVRFEIVKMKEVNLDAVAINFQGINGENILNIHNYDACHYLDNLKKKLFLEVELPTLPLYPGDYFVEIVVKHSTDKYFFFRESIGITIIPNEQITDRQLVMNHGVFFLKSLWRSVTR